MRLIVGIAALMILLAPVSASAHGKNECHRHADKDSTYHCH
jgi:uncharacterized membrane protein YuzA (DUF378 family)